MKKATILIALLCLLLILQLSYIVYGHYKNHKTVDAILHTRHQINAQINFTEVAPKPPHRDFIIANFESPDYPPAMDTENGSVSFSNEHVISGDYSLRFDYEAGSYRALELYSMPRDWQYYHRLNFTMFNPLPDSIGILIRIDDHQSDIEPSSYFARNLTLPPGFKSFSLKVENIGNKIDLENLYRIVFSISEPTSSGTIYLDNIILRLNHTEASE